MSIQTQIERISGEVNEQKNLISQIRTALQGKAAGGGTATPTQKKNVEITENGTVEVLPDEGYALSKVAAVVTVGSGGESDLPTGYGQVDYIQFSEKQIVDTGIVCNKNTRIRLAFTREKSTQHYLYGVSSSGNTASVTAYLGGSWRYGNKSATKTPTANENMIYSAVVDSSQITLTGSASTISSVNEFETIGTLLIGTCRSADGEVGDPQFVGKIFFFSIWQGDEQVLKMTPVVSAEGVYRFWDTVGKKFHDSINGEALEGGNL